jgi:hypothetical protein
VRVDGPQKLRRVGPEADAAAALDLSPEQRERAEPRRGADDERLDEDIVAVGVLPDVDGDAVLGVSGAEADRGARRGSGRAVVVVGVVFVLRRRRSLSVALIVVVAAAAPAAASESRSSGAADARLRGRAGH